MAAAARRLRAALHQLEPRRTSPAGAAAGDRGGTTIEESDDDRAAASAAHQFLDTLVADHTTSGACLAVSRRGRHVSTSAVGHSGPEAPSAITHGLQGHMELQHDSIFMVASITKPVTVTAAIILVQERRLHLDDRVVDHLPAFDASHDVRVRHLLSHISGLPDSWAGNHTLRRHQAPLAEYVREQLGVGLLFSPGTNVSYSSTAIDLLAAIIEKVVGQPLSLFLHQRVFAPLGMHDTSLGHLDSMPPGAASVTPGWLRHKQREVCLNVAPGRYNRAGRTVGDEHELPLGSLSFGNTDYWRTLGCPSGGLCSTAPDLLRFMNGFLLCGSADAVAGFPLSAESVALMTRPHTDEAVAAAAAAGSELLDRGSWGLGWRINSEGSARLLGTKTSSRAFGAHGSSGCMVWACPESGMACVVLTPEPDLCESEEFNVLSDLLLPRSSSRNETE
jgi:CubicO group peptidase (beta-lactamase class C family)